MVSPLPAPEAEVVAADEARAAVLPAEQIQKILPVGFQHPPVKGQGDHPADPAAQQPLPVRGGVDEHRGRAQHQGVRVIPEGHNSGVQSVFRRQTAAFVEKGLVPQMDTVKKAQRINRFLHSTSKKLLIVSIFPSLTWASIKNSPPWA